MREIEIHAKLFVIKRRENVSKPYPIQGNGMDQQELEKRNQVIVRMRLEGYIFKDIQNTVGVSKTRCSQIYRRWATSQPNLFLLM